MPMTPLLDRIQLRREVDGSKVVFYASAGLHPEIELEDELKRLSSVFAKEIKAQQVEDVKSKLRKLKSEKERLEVDLSYTQSEINKTETFLSAA